ncbi:MAG: SDR family NAD(P)-dependent oxidoreductase [Candidatus Sericytochromatia bacterium]
MNLADKQILITGATDGIGLQTARLLASKGARLLLHGRDSTRLEQAAFGLNPAPELLKADLSSLAEIRELVALLASRPALDVLVNNAGIGIGTKDAPRELSQDGIELHWAVNFLAPFTLTEGLISANKAPGVIVNVASAGQAAFDFANLMLERDYSGMQAYCQSKLALIAWTFDLAERRPDLRINALHPGSLLDTKMVQETFGYALGKPESGAEAIVNTIKQGLAGVSGSYFNVLQPARAQKLAYDPDARDRLRQWAEAILSQ